MRFSYQISRDKAGRSHIYVLTYFQNTSTPGRVHSVLSLVSSRCALAHRFTRRARMFEDTSETVWCRNLSAQCLKSNLHGSSHIREWHLRIDHANTQHRCFINQSVSHIMHNVDALYCRHLDFTTSTMVM